MALRAIAPRFILALASATALHHDLDNLARARAEAAQAVEAASQAVARAKAAQQRVRDLGGTEDPDRPFWFVDLFPDPVRDEAYVWRPYPVGPTPIDDLGILYAAIREMRPKTMVEFGFWAGDGTRAILSAADAGATCHSYDPWPQEGQVDKLKAQVPGTGRNFVFHQKPGEDITPEDVGFNKVGFAFMDAQHNVTQNQLIFEKLLPLLTDDAIVAVHDTGGFSKKFLDEHKDDADVKWWWQTIDTGVKREFPWAWPLKAHGTGDEQYYISPHVKNERLFVNWVKDTHPEWGSLNFHSFNTLRLGVTMLQRQRKLETNG